MLNSKVPKKYQEIYSQYFQLFLTKIKDIEDTSCKPTYGFCNTLSAYLANASYTEVMDEIVCDVYRKHIKSLSLKEILALAKHIDDVVQSEYELMSEEGGVWNKNDVFNMHSIALAEHEFEKPHLAYFVLAIMQFSECLPDLQSSKPNHLNIDRFLNIQKSIYRGDTVFQLSQLQKEFSNYINISKEEMAKAIEQITLKSQNDREEIARRAGKARSHKKYAAIKVFDGGQLEFPLNDN